MRFSRLLLLLLLTFHVSNLAADSMKKILRLLEKEDIEKAVEELKEGLLETSDHPGYLWVASELTSTDTLPYYDIDSAYILIKSSLIAYDSASEDMLEEFEKVDVTRVDLLATDLKIRDLHWSRTQLQMTMVAIQQFRERYPEAPQNDEAIFMRDSLAYDQALAANTWQTYREYIKTYPQSVFYTRANERYEQLLYQSKTATGTLESYRSFVSEFPNSPYREDALGFVLDYELFWDDTEPLIRFVNQYPESVHIGRALDYLYHLAPQLLIDPIIFGRHPRLDSLEHIDALNQLEIFAYPGEEGIQMITLDQASRLSPNTHRLLGEGVYCDIYPYDFIAANTANSTMTQLKNRSGQVFFEGTLIDFKEVGFGLILVLSPDGSQLIHKTGDLVLNKIDDAALFVDRWVKVKRNKKWAIASINGTLLSSFEYDEVTELGNFVIFQKDGLYAISNPAQVTREAGRGGFSLSFKYDDFELVNDQWIIGFKGQNEGLIDDQLQFVIPWDKHTIFPNEQLPYAKKGNSYKLFPPTSLKLPDELFQDILINEQWLALKQNSWRITTLDSIDFRAPYDSVRLIGSHHLFGQASDSSWLFFNQDSAIWLEQETSLLDLSYTPSNKSYSQEEEYILSEKSSTKKVYDRTGRLLFSGNYSDIKVMGDSLFAVTAQRKTGVIDSDGQVVIPPVYDFISKSEGMLSLLSKNKIGAYSLEDSVLIEAKYASNITKVGHYYRTSLQGVYGLLDSVGNEALSFAYNEISFFNDSLVWVKTDSSWQVESINKQTVYQYGIRSFEPIKLANQLVYRVLTSKGYGILTSQAKYIVPAAYSSIQLVQGSEEAIFIGEKSVSVAGFYIWVGYDQQGNRIFSEAYREEDYDRFACD